MNLETHRFIADYLWHDNSIGNIQRCVAALSNKLNITIIEAQNLVEIFLQERP